MIYNSGNQRPAPPPRRPAPKVPAPKPVPSKSGFGGVVGRRTL